MLFSRPGGHPLDFVRVFDRLAGRLDELGHPYALAGALALHAYGQSRATFDLDLLTTRAAQEPLGTLLRRAARRLTTEQYLKALAGLVAPPLEVLRARKRARGGEPFSLRSA